MAGAVQKEGVGVSISVTPAGAGSETMDMDLMPKAVWGLTEQAAWCRLSAAAAHTQKGLPAFGIYGRDVQDAGDTSMPEDVRESFCVCHRSGCCHHAQQTYLAMGGTSMGIAGSMVNHDFFESYLGMRVEEIDMSEFQRGFSWASTIARNLKELLPGPGKLQGRPGQQP